jgi:seryl-tRNA synthetase
MAGIKFAITIAFLLSAASLAGNWFLYENYQILTTERADWQAEEAQLQDRNKQIESQASQLTKEAERLRSQVKDYVNQRDQVRKELDQSRKEAGNLAKQIKEIEAEKETLNLELTEGQVVEKTVVQQAAKQPVAVVKTEPKEEKQPEEQPEEQKKEEIALPLTAPAPAPATKVLEDTRPNQVLSLNRQFNFAVVNMGLDDKVKIGDTLQVEQDGKLVARLQVEKLYENFSACAILEEIKPAQIKEGDLVRLA